MIFTLDTTKDGYDEDRAEELSKALGFVFDPPDKDGRRWKRSPRPVRVIETLEALDRFIEMWGPIVIRYPRPYESNKSLTKLVIELYDLMGR